MTKIKIPQVAELKTIFELCKDNNAEVRLVGGVVRDILFKKDMGDIDLAINVDPKQTTKIFETAGYKVVPTGIDYGTVTVVINDVAFEITSLRKDVETDGRRAVVSYTTDWKVDSIRRDFTINAIYADEQGNLYDYHNGLADFKNKQLKFVGDADLRIKEDSLRILRLFRFATTTGFEVADDVYEVCKNNAGLIKGLSVERVANEMIKILSSQNFTPDVIHKMKDVGILQSIIPFPIQSDLPMFENKTLKTSNDYITKIIALTDGSYDKSNTILNVWKLSNADKKALQNIFKVFKDRTFVPQMLHKFLYYYDYNTVLTGALLKDEKFYEFVLQNGEGEKPEFPITGDDLIALGVEKGVKLGSLLKAVESWWVDNNFKPRKNDCLLYAKQIEKI